jgi:hypothetical protein
VGPHDDQVDRVPLDGLPDLEIRRARRQDALGLDPFSLHAPDTVLHHVIQLAADIGRHAGVSHRKVHGIHRQFHDMEQNEPRRTDAGKADRVVHRHARSL